jgi:luciferase family oxidoreductase group 1
VVRPLPLSVLELAPVCSGQTAAQALADTTTIAQLAEELGYRRIWVAEHHNTPSVASTSPEVLIAHLAGQTDRIRVGSGGVMLPNHAPFAVAERFAMLEALYPGRIDLGLGRAPGTDLRTSAALRSGNPQLVPDQLIQLSRYLADGDEGIRAIYGEHDEPELWMLGSSDGGARIAAALGMRFAFAHHFSPQYTDTALAIYRESFRASERLERPHVMVAAGIVVGDDDADAARRALPIGVSIMRLMVGRPAPVPTVEEAEALVERLSPEQRAMVESAAGLAIAGTAETVLAGLDDLAQRTQADEMMVTGMLSGPAQRLRMLKTVAAAFEPSAQRASS